MQRAKGSTAIETAEKFGHPKAYTPALDHTRLHEATYSGSLLTEALVVKLPVP